MHEADAAKAKSDLYRVASVALRCPHPGAAWPAWCSKLLDDLMEGLRLCGLSKEAQEGVSKLAEAASGLEGWQEDLFREQRVEYTRLFAHPKNPAVPIYEQLFLTTSENEPDFGSVIITSPAATNARMLYREAGVDLTENESADHMAIEMEHMAFLYAGLATELDLGDDEGVDAWYAHINAFVATHMDRWAHAFYLRLAHEACHPFYRAFGRGFAAAFEERVLP